MTERKTQIEITAAIQDIYALVRRSPTPLSQLSRKISSLISQGWMEDDAEQACFGVIETLLKSRGWKYLTELVGKQKQPLSKDAVEPQQAQVVLDDPQSTSQNTR
jgi:hypothetical protein